MNTTKTPKLQVNNLYKIFGDNPQEALVQVQSGVSKPELLTEHAHVLGLQDINISIEAGKITVIMGLSGSGKSTLIRHLNRLIEPTSGQILLDGEDILALDEASLRQVRNNRMSMVFQKFGLFPHRTVLENTILGQTIRGTDKKQAEQSGEQWLEKVGLQGYEQHFPRQLSGGMQQRVGIARALCSEAEIMLMDEAYSALDPIIRTDMQTLLLDLQQELHKTIVFITHDLDESLRLADHLVILNEGRVVQQGEPQSIILHPADEYIQNFVRDINRARVIRVRTLMDSPTNTKGDLSIDYEDTLENAITLGDGQSNIVFDVTKEGKKVGQLSMKKIIRSLVSQNREVTESV